MDGLLVVDKPAGPTSHDVVARIRRVLHERRVGHTGTLDPAATGVLPLVLGRATRLARFLTAGDKEYEAIITLGVRTTTYDAEGDIAGQPWAGELPSATDVERALDPFRGTFEQRPPAFSAKKINGVRSYKLARRSAGGGSDAASEPDAGRPAPVRVTVRDLRLVAIARDRFTIRIVCSAGFYVRSLAHDLGERLGVGAHLAALRRLRSGDFDAASALDLAAAERDPATAARAVIPLEGLLTTWPSVVLNADGVRHATVGRDLGPGDAAGEVFTAAAPRVRLLAADGRLVGVAERSAAGVLHPAVVFV